MKPLIKWVGGKTKLLPILTEIIPHQYNTYYEPFIGGGAMFFHLNPENAVIGDVNHRLISMYRSVRNTPKTINTYLSYLKERQYSEVFYYELRDSLNTPYLPHYMQAAMLIYINKTCFNGLYRENKKGYFNVPFGKYKKLNLPSSKDILEVSIILRNTRILCSPYTQTLHDAKEGDFVYLDPPYYNLFNSYNKGGFDNKAHHELKDYCDLLTAKGVKFMMSNSNHEDIKELYKGYNITILNNVNHAINRAKTSEVVIRNY